LRLVFYLAVRLVAFAVALHRSLLATRRRAARRPLLRVGACRWSLVALRCSLLAIPFRLLPASPVASIARRRRRPRVLFG
jgi:hypothetical protein